MDASFILDSGNCWAGVVSRDHDGRVLISTCRTLKQARSAEEAEGQAALIGIQALAKSVQRASCVGN